MIGIIIIISLFCEGLNIILDEGMLLGFIRPWIDQRLKPQSFMRYVLKPIVFCHICFASVWGTIVYCLIVDQFLINEWIVCIISATYLNGLLYNLKQKIE